jgi:CRP/FNR family transcriptional regulator, cyclic AMP receptor protein
LQGEPAKNPSFWTKDTKIEQTYAKVSDFWFRGVFAAAQYPCEEDLVDQLFNSSEKRLVRVLLLLARFGKEGTPQTVVPKISQEVPAEMVGTARSRVSFFMNRFRKLGFIHYNGELEVRLPAQCRFRD